MPTSVNISLTHHPIPWSVLTKKILFSVMHKSVAAFSRVKLWNPDGTVINLYDFSCYEHYICLPRFSLLKLPLCFYNPWLDTSIFFFTVAACQGENNAISSSDSYLLKDTKTDGKIKYIDKALSVLLQIGRVGWVTPPFYRLICTFHL